MFIPHRVVQVKENKKRKQIYIDPHATINTTELFENCSQQPQRYFFNTQTNKESSRKKITQQHTSNGKKQMLIKKYEEEKSKKTSMAGSCRIFSAQLKNGSRKDAKQHQTLRNYSSLDKKTKTEMKSYRKASRDEESYINYSLDLKKTEDNNKAFRSLNLQQEEPKIKSKIEKSSNKCNINCLTIIPWLKQRDHPILKRQKNLFEYYMNEIKRKRDQRTINKKLMQEQDHSPFIIKTIQDKPREITESEIKKMEEMYRNWRSNNKMLISGRAISIQRSKNTSPGKYQNSTLDKKSNGFVGNGNKPRQEAKIQAWQNDNKLQKDESPQF